MKKLKVGDQAPNFSLLNENNEKVSLSDYSGKKIVLYFYPKDLTPGCTKQACNISENYSVLLKKGYIVLGVSPDSSSSHLKFINKYSLPFSLLADTNKEVINLYGVWGLKKFMGREYEGVLRVTFIINENQFIENIIDKVKTNDHSNQILNFS